MAILTFLIDIGRIARILFPIKGPVIYGSGSRALCARCKHFCFMGANGCKVRKVAPSRKLAPSHAERRPEKLGGLLWLNGNP